MGYIEPTKVKTRGGRRIGVFAWIIIVVIICLLMFSFLLKKTTMFKKDMSDSKYVGTWEWYGYEHANGEIETWEPEGPEITLNADGTGVIYSPPMDPKSNEKTTGLYWREYDTMIVYATTERGFGGGIFSKEGENELCAHHREGIHCFLRDFYRKQEK